MQSLVQTSQQATLDLTFILLFHNYCMKPETKASFDLWATMYEKKAWKEQNKKVDGFEHIHISFVFSSAAVV